MNKKFLKRVEAIEAVYEAYFETYISTDSKIEKRVFFLLYSFIIPLLILSYEFFGFDNTSEDNIYWFNGLEFLIFTVLYFIPVLKQLIFLMKLAHYPQARLIPSHQTPLLLFAGVIQIIFAMLFVVCFVLLGVTWYISLSLYLSILTTYFIFILPKKFFYKIHLSDGTRLGFIFPIVWLVQLTTVWLFPSPLKSNHSITFSTLLTAYLYVPHFFYMLPMTIGLLIIFIFIKRILFYPVETNEMGIRSLPTNDDKLSEMYNENNFQRYNPRHFLEQITPSFFRKTPQYHLYHRQALWKFGNEVNLWNNYFTVILISLIMTAIFIFTSFLDRLSYIILLFAYVMSQTILQSITETWFRRIQISPPELLKPASRTKIANEFYWSYVKDLLKPCLVILIGCVAFLVISPRNTESFLSLITFLCVNLFDYIYSAWSIPIQVKTMKSNPDDRNKTAYVLSFILLTFSWIIINISQFIGFHNQLYYIISGALFLFGIKFLYFGREHWQNIEWGAK